MALLRTTLWSPQVYYFVHFCEKRLQEIQLPSYTTLQEYIFHFNKKYPTKWLFRTTRLFEISDKQLLTTPTKSQAIAS